MRNILLVSMILGLSAGGAASAQEKAMKLPADVNPVSLTRLPPLKRDDLNDEGKAIYDKIVGTGPAPTTGPVALSLYSPKIAQVFSDLNGYLRYNGDLSPRHTEVAIVAATWEIQQQYEYSAHEPAALKFGAPQAVIDTIKFNREPVGLSPEETMIIKLSRAIMRDHKVELRALRRGREALRPQGARRARDGHGRLRHGRHGHDGHRPAPAGESAGAAAAALALGTPPNPRRVWRRGISATSQVRPAHASSR